MLRFFKRRHKKEEGSYFFLKNGSMLLESISSTSNCRYDIPYRNFTDVQLINATNNFTDLVMDDASGSLFRGSFQNRPIWVKRYHDFQFGEGNEKLLSYINHDMAISLMMCHHKNVLKFLGCCLDFYAPALVYECTGNDELLYDILYPYKKHTSKKDARSLSWKNRLKVATDVGNALSYLHIAFATPFIYRDLSPWNIIIDHFGVAKLLNFSFCISLPPGETHVADRPIRVMVYSDPEYMATGIITGKSDVYMFGVLLLILLTGREWIDPHPIRFYYLYDYVKEHIDNNCLNKALDSLILEEKGEAIEQQLQALAELALRCCQHKGEDRPDMTDVAKELSRIERSGRSG